MKKLALSLAIISALGLSACDSETIEDVQKEVAGNGSAVKSLARVVYDPSNGVLSVPNDLLFSGSQDGTLNLPVEDATDFSDPTVAMSALDGWSTSNPFVLALDFPTDTSLDADSVMNPASVKIYETIMGGDATDAGCATVTRGLACKVVGELTFGVDFIAQAKGNSIAIVPLKPFKAKTGYVVALTNNLKDSNGTSIAGSLTYEAVRQDITDNPLVTDSQLLLQGIINSYENAIVAGGADKDSLIYTFAMTTQSTIDVSFSAKAVLASNAALYQATGGVQGSLPTIDMMDTGISVADVFASLPVNPIPAELMGLYSAANYMQGSVTLPYYLGIPTKENPMAPINDWWKAKCDSGATLAGLAAANPGAIPADAVSVNDGECMAISQQAGLPAPGLRDLSSIPAFADLDKERNLSKYNPVPAARAISDIPGMSNPGEITVQMTTPDIDVANAVRTQMGIPGELVKPEGGWPIVILQHGITSKKEDMLALTGILSLYGLATAAIDHPLHGSRGFDLDPNSPGDEINASTVTPTHYLNLSSLLTARDNLRQSSSDSLGLRFGLNFMGFVDNMGQPIASDVNASKVHYLGHSLGAITGINLVGLANSPLDPEIDDKFAITTNSLAMPGTMIANFLLESGSFGDIIKSQVTYQSVEGFQEYVTVKHPDGYTDEELVIAYHEFYSTLDPAGEAALAGLFAQFSFAAQTVLDSADPLNYAGVMKATQTPTYLIEVVGGGVGSDGFVNLQDQVIPNLVPTSPTISGTEGAINLLGLAGISETTQDADAPVSGAVRYIFGHHSSILSPAPVQGIAPDAAMTGLATSEMQSQVANFFSSEGHLISVSENGSTVIK